MKSNRVKWPVSLVQETGNSVLLCFWVNVVPILLKPLWISFCFLKIEFARVNHFFQINLRSDSLDYFSFLIELFYRVFDFLLLLIGNQISLIKQYDVCKLNLITHQLENRPIICLIHIIEDLWGDFSRVEVGIKVAAVHYSHACIELRELLQLCGGLRDARIQ